MKKIILFFYVLLFIIPISLAGQGNTFRLDFNDYKSYTVILMPSDQVVFELNGVEAHVIVDKVNSRDIELDIFSFFEGNRNPTYTALSYDNYVEVDVEKDGKKDLEIRLDKIYKTNGRAKFTLSLIEDKTKDNIEITGNDVKEVIGNNRSSVGIILGIAAGVLILWMMLRIILSKKKNKDIRNKS